MKLMCMVLMPADHVHLGLLVKTDANQLCNFVLAHHYPDFYCFRKYCFSQINMETCLGSVAQAGNTEGNVCSDAIT